MKARIRKTGEIVEIISYSGSTIRNECIDKVSYIDSKGVEHDRETLNYYWDFEQLPDVEEDNFPNTDWNQVRIDAAISAMQGIISKNDDYTYKEIAVHAVGYAEALVKELEKTMSL
jgi:hypothetical protein